MGGSRTVGLPVHICMEQEVETGQREKPGYRLQSLPPEISCLQLVQPLKASTGFPRVPSGMIQQTSEPVLDIRATSPPCSASLCVLGHFVSPDKFLEMELLI